MQGTLNLQREILSVLPQSDPIGFLSPIIIKFKMFFQELCKAKIGWDEPLEGELKKGWRPWLLDYKASVHSHSQDSIYKESQRRSSPLIFMDLEMLPGRPMQQCFMGSYVNFVASRSRVAPLKEEAIPRLELLAALIVARLMSHVGKALEPEVVLMRWSAGRIQR